MPNLIGEFYRNWQKSGFLNSLVLQLLIGAAIILNLTVKIVYTFVLLSFVKLAFAQVFPLGIIKDVQGVKKGIR